MKHDLNGFGEKNKTMLKNMKEMSSYYFPVKATPVKYDTVCKKIIFKIFSFKVLLLLIYREILRLQLYVSLIKLFLVERIQ